MVLSRLEGDRANRYLARDAAGQSVWLRRGDEAALQSEAAVLSAVAHPSAAVVLERFSHDGTAFLALRMEPDAVPFSRLEVGPAQAVALALQLCQTAQAWHDAGYLYGDFSPHSVCYLPASGSIRLVGAPAAVMLNSAGPADDVHGLAATLYRLLARGARATLPLGGAGALPPLQEVRPELPADLCAVLNQALSPQAEDRFQAPAVLAAALDSVMRPYRLAHGSATDRGGVRPVNQDAVYAASFSAAGADRGRGGGGVFVCCDGMGGAAGGEVAAGMTTETVGGTVASFLSSHLAREPGPRPSELEGCLRAAVGRANRLLRERMRESPALFGMGSTVTAVAISDDSAVVVHVGDSRCYRWAPGGPFQCLTGDQSLAGQMVAAGQMTEAEARTRPERTMLLQAVGSRETLEPEVAHLTLRPEQKLLLTSDGVHSFIPDEELAEMLGKPISPGAIANMIVNTAISRGSDDNCSAIVVAVHGRVD